MAAPFTLGPDEGIILETTTQSGELTLTHERIIWVVRGFFGGVKSVSSVYLSDMKVIDDEVQVSLRKRDGVYVLTACMDSGAVIDYGFPTKYEAQTWVNEISEQVVGHQSRNAYVESDAVRAVKDVVIQVKGAAKSLGASIGVAVTGSRRGLPARSEQEGAGDPTEDLGLLDEQMSALKKLKGLLDAGILTQEEFDQKKRDILGL